MKTTFGPGLETRNLTFRDRGPYTFAINSGECVGLQGVSGAGKTLLLRAIADLDPRGGEIWLNGVGIDAMEAHQWRKSVAMLPAESFWWYDRVAEHFFDFSQLDQSLLNDMGFDYTVGAWLVSRLSTGEKQRLAIVRLLANQPACLLLDEPTASLDPDNVNRVEALLKHYCISNTIPMLWVSHDPEQLLRVSDRRFFMEHTGRLEQLEGGGCGC